MITEHPVRCPARLSFSALPGNHTHECIHPARRPDGVEGVLEHQCHCGTTWTERTSAGETPATEVAKSNQRVTKAYAEELDKALQLLAEYVDDEPCHIDHNGYCQEHALSSTRQGGCRNVRAKRLLADNSAGGTKTSNEED